MAKKPDRVGGIPRRGFLQLAAGAAAASAFGTVTGCGPSEEGAQVVELKLDELPVGTRVVVLLGELPVEVRRTDSGVFGRSLWCTHMGCAVRWMEDRQVYFCPCHEGVYDSEGKPRSGPPTTSLRDVPVVLEGESILVG